MSKWTVDGFAGTSELGVPIVVLSHPSGSQERCKATSVESVLRSLNREDEFDAIKAERDAALERVRVLEAECRAARVLLVNAPVAGAIPEDCWTLATDIPRFADTNYSDARRATDAANALGDGGAA